MRFETLHRFTSHVKATQVSLTEGELLPLDEGMRRAVEYLRDVKSSDKKVLLIGNGGSAAIASHQAVDLWRNAGLRAMAFSDASLLTCIANDFGYNQVFSQPIEMFCDPGDCLIAVSSSGQSVNILQAVDKARAKGANVVTFSGFSDENQLRSRGDLNFYLPSVSYGIVEVGHLLLLHAVIDDFVEGHKKARNDTRVSKKSLHANVTHPTRGRSDRRPIPRQ